MNVHKKKIAGIDRSVLHRVNHRVSRGVRRASIEKMHILVADLECEFAFESFRRGHQYIVFEVEILSPGGDELRSLAKRVRIVDNRLELFGRSEEHTSELQSLMRISYAVFCLKKK